MCLQHFDGKGPNRLLSAGSRAARRKIRVSGISSCPNYCEMFTVYKQFTKVGADRITQLGRTRVGDVCITYSVCVCVCVCACACACVCVCLCLCLCVCVYSCLYYPACKGHALYCVVVCNCLALPYFLTVSRKQ